MKSCKYCIFCISIIKSLKKFTTILPKRYNHGRKYDCDKRFFLILVSLRMTIRIYMKLTLSLKRNEQLLLKYKRGNDIQEHGKQQNE